MLNNIKVVLVGTSHSGNIGASARAMKTMGLSNLVLVSPQATIDGKTMAMAAGAGDIVQNATHTETLSEALSGCKLVIATSARQRGLDWPTLSPREAGLKLSQESMTGTTAIIFGCEKHGLSNEQLQFADFHVIIDANSSYSSLNLAQAVQILCYEARTASLSSDKPTQKAEPLCYPSQDDMEKFYLHLEDSLKNTGFIITNHPGQIMYKLRRFFQRARPEQNELNILRGILSSIDKKHANNNQYQ
jgi:tRNA (cytidine32/uridine32-2'-O)-methyltransferase